MSDDISPDEETHMDRYESTLADVIKMTDARRQAAMDQHPSVVSNVFEKDHSKDLHQTTHMSQLDISDALHPDVTPEDLKKVAENLRLNARLLMGTFLKLEEICKNSVRECMELADKLDQS